MIGSLACLKSRLFACGADVGAWHEIGVRNIVFKFLGLKIFLLLLFFTKSAVFHWIYSHNVYLHYHNPTMSIHLARVVCSLGCLPLSPLACLVDDT